MKRIGFILIAIACGTVTSLSQNTEMIKSALSEGQVIVDTVHSSALENNFLGDSPDRPVSIYLPPGYDSSPDNQYPVIYFLHSYEVDHTAFFGGWPWYSVDFKTICNDLISSGKIDPMIVISPNSVNKYWGSFYTNSIVTGNWADFISRDLVDYMDINYRTVPQKESRGVAGHCMGGYGTIWLIMNYPDVFNAAYMFSGLFGLEKWIEISKDDLIEAINADSLEGLDWRTVAWIAAAAAFSPDPSALPFYCQFPVDTSGEAIDSIWQKWLQYDPLTLIPSFKDSILQLQAIQFDCGINDDLVFIETNREFSEALNDLGVAHVFEEHNGNHTNKLAERIETKLLPFFSANLSKHFLTDTVMIPDTAFLYALIDEGVDTNGDSLISYAEAELVISLDIQYRGITDMTGIEAFVNIETLECSDNKLISLDVSGCTALNVLNCWNSQLTSLDVSNNPELEFLNCGHNQLTSLDVSNNPALDTLWCYINQLTSLDISVNPVLISLDCSDNQLTSLDDSHNSVLEFLNCNNNQLLSLDVFTNAALEVLFCEANQLTSLDVTNNISLMQLSCGENQLTSLDVTNNSSLILLACWYNQLTYLDVSKNTSLEYLYCFHNQLSSLDISPNSTLKYFNCRDNQITSLNVSENSALIDLGCGGNQLKSLDISNNTSIEILRLENMSSLNEVCVWEGFDVGSVDVYASGSPNICFQTDCNGDCSVVGMEKECFSGMVIYPNPTGNLLTIETENPSIKHISLFSVNGQQIIDMEMEGTTNQLDLSSFQKGVYFITIRSKDFVTTRKIIKLN